MPVSRSTAFRDFADVYGPSTPGTDDGYGNLNQSPATDALIASSVKIGLFSEDVSRDWIKDIGGGPANLLDWSVAVPNALIIKDGYSFHVAAGDNPGVYRVKQHFRVPGRALTFCVCNKEKSL